MTGNVAAPPAQRVDKWLWCARIFKTRTLAAKVVADGKVRLSRGTETLRIEKASALVRAGDRLSFSLGGRIRVLEVVACGLRRGPASEAQLLYTDHSPPPPPREARGDAAFARMAGAGRPTKKERRELDRLKGAPQSEGMDDAFEA